MLDKKQVEDIRKDFLYLDKEYKNPIVYLDNAATSQKPIQVIDSVSEFYKYENANPHRGAHTLSVLSTDVYESGREKNRQIHQRIRFFRSSVHKKHHRIFKFISLFVRL